MDNQTLSCNTLKEELIMNMTLAVLPVTIYIGILMVVGIIGNILVIVIFSKQHKQSNFKFFVLSVAYVDLTSCCTTLPGEIFIELYWYDFKHDVICRLKPYLNVVTALYSASILLILAYDRHRKICKPLAWQIHPPLVARMFLIALILSILIAIPTTHFWGMQTYTQTYENCNITVSVCDKSIDYVNSFYPLIYLKCVYIIPIGLMVFVAGTLNVWTAKSIFGRISTDQTDQTATDPSCAAALSISSHSGETNTNQSNFSQKDCSECVTNNYSGNIPEITLDDSSESSIKRPCVSMSRSLPNLSSYVQNINVDNCSKTHSDLSKIPAKDDANKGKQSLVIKSRFDKSEGTKAKTIVMLVLTTVYVITMIIYIILTGFIDQSDSILSRLSDSEKATVFFFWRLYFINYVVNPILYGVVDIRFRKELVALVKRTPVGNSKN